MLTPPEACVMINGRESAKASSSLVTRVQDSPTGRESDASICHQDRATCVIFLAYGRGYWLQGALRFPVARLGECAFRRDPCRWVRSVRPGRVACAGQGTPGLAGGGSELPAPSPLRATDRLWSLRGPCRKAHLAMYVRHRPGQRAPWRPVRFYHGKNVAANRWWAIGGRTRVLQPCEHLSGAGRDRPCRDSVPDPASARRRAVLLWCVRDLGKHHHVAPSEAQWSARRLAGCPGRGDLLAAEVQKRHVHG